MAHPLPTPLNRRARKPSLRRERILAPWRRRSAGRHGGGAIAVDYADWGAGKVMAINRARGFNGVPMLALAGLARNAWADRRGVRFDGFDPFGNPQAWATFDLGSAEDPGNEVASTAADSLRRPLNRDASVLCNTAYPSAESMVSAESRIAIRQKCLADQPRLQAGLPQNELARHSKTSPVLSEKWP